MIAAFPDRLWGRQREERAIGSHGGEFHGFRSTSSGYGVSQRVAENLSTLSACVAAIAGTIATMPALIYRRTPSGREEVDAHPAARLIRAPNAWQTWPDFLEFLVAQTLLHGNGLAIIEHDGAGRPVALIPVPWGNVGVVLLPGGRLAFDVTLTGSPWGHAAPQRRRLLPGEYLHLKDRSDDGLIGRSRLSRSAEVVGTAAALQDYIGSLWHNGAMPAGALKFPTRLSHEQVERIRGGVMASHTGPRNAHKTLILEAGVEWQSLSVSPEDAEVLASRRFTAEELARLYSVPPPIVGDLSHGTFTNSREAGRWFAQFTLTPWCRKIEAEFARSVFTDPAMMLEIDMSALLRGDAETRWQSHKIAVEAGILDPDEIREVEGWNPRRDREVPLAS